MLLRLLLGGGGYAVYALAAPFMLFIAVYAVYDLFCAVYAVYAISSLDTGAPLRHRTRQSHGANTTLLTLTTQCAEWPRELRQTTLRISK